ncbi:MAG: hypothetical protein PHN56_01340 [Candidatus Nanoarchaeia archaeon]|nr:hypothetical protein [Candidatus Nanoarchaeia archaeon]
MNKLTEDEIEFMKELDDEMVNLDNLNFEEKELVNKLVDFGYIKVEKTAGFNNYFYQLTNKAIKEFNIKL